MPTAIDLTFSDDDEDIVHTGGNSTAAQAPASMAAILAAALARAGGASYSGLPQGTPRAGGGNASADALAAQRRLYAAGAPAPGGALAGAAMLQHMYWSPLTLSVASSTRFKISCDTALPPQALRVIKITPGAEKNAETGAWELPLSQHVNFYMAMQRERIVCERIPQRVLCSLATATAVDTDLSGENDRMDEDGYAKGDDDDDENAISDIPRKIWDALAPFQKQGVSWIVRRNGRALLADEPGLGKTIQAIGAAAAYYHEWPLLVVTPSSARYHWEAELLQWLPEEGGYLPKDGIAVITSEKMAAIHLVEHAKVIVTSYDLVHREQVKRALLHIAPKVVICDECHYLKNGKAQRTKSLLPIIKNARRAILLSGTPALSRPIEVFWQLHALDSEQWSDPAEFNRRYCSGKKQKAAAAAAAGEDKEKDEGFSGASNLEELHTLLRATLMLRRNKATILKKLPPKKRVQVEVSIDDPNLAAELRAELEEFRSRASQLAELSRGSGGIRNPRKRRLEDDVLAPGEDAEQAAERRKGMAMEKKALLMQLFRRSGAAKLPAIARHVDKILSAEGAGKLLIFAHHRHVLDDLSAGVLKNVPHIRIDGNTPAKDRMQRVNRFQQDATIRVAVLGITAAGIALTLTAASHVIFTELYWTPAALIQAEDRAHRIGQTSQVLVEYLLAPDCVDDVLWPCIQHKMLMLGELFENKKKLRMDAAVGTCPDDDAGALEASDDGDVDLEELEELHHEDPEAAVDDEEAEDARGSPALGASTARPTPSSSSASNERRPSPPTVGDAPPAGLAQPAGRASSAAGAPAAPSAPSNDFRSDSAISSFFSDASDF
ncbi:P-loop containing nucleoside triphosphate hydrolase protein [Pelagophyceae sp. CCMP2097]|nr:P-loop containing nucleoside triphosphate hydrolase protein [Pelagophyceae sp. CCMP2097]